MRVAIYAVLALAVLYALLTLTGCAAWQQAISGAAAAAAVSARAAEDENIRVWVFNACATPYDATLRNPQIVPAMKLLCGESVLLEDVTAAATPATGATK